MKLDNFTRGYMLKESEGLPDPSKEELALQRGALVGATPAYQLPEEASGDLPWDALAQTLAPREVSHGWAPPVNRVARNLSPGDYGRLRGYFDLYRSGASTEELNSFLTGDRG